MVNKMLKSILLFVVELFLGNKLASIFGAKRSLYGEFNSKTWRE